MLVFWKAIPNFPQYQINNVGQVRNKETGTVLVPFKNYKGYHQLRLYYKGKRQNFVIHRLVAKAFISNPSNFPMINHKDCNKINNLVKNLEWCDNKYNVRYSFQMGMVSHNKGRAMSEEQKKKISESQKKRWFIRKQMFGEVNWVRLLRLR